MSQDRAMQRFLSLVLLFALFFTIQAYAMQPEVVLKPKMRPEPLSKAINTVDTEELSSYFENITIFDKPADFDKLPYVIAFDNDATMGATGDIAYTTGIDQSEKITAFSLLSPGKKFIDPDTKEELGFYADSIGNAEVIRWGNVQTIKITYALTSIDPGIKITPRIGLDLPSVIEVRYPERPMSGRVLQVDNDIIGVGHFAVAVISIGARDGAKSGDLLNILEAPKHVRDVNTHKNVLLPEESFGQMLIYKAFEKVSLAIITESDKPVIIGDKLYGSPSNSLADVEFKVAPKCKKRFCLGCLIKCVKSKF